MIAFKNVHKFFGPLHVLDDISFRVEPGAVVVISGPSGSGKSTLLRCINRLERIDRGEITVTNNAVFAPYELYLVLALGYFVSCFAITRVVRWFDPKYQLLE